MTAADPAEYLGADDVVQSSHPDVVALATRLREEHSDDAEFARAAFEWVRDAVAHSVDAQDPRVTLTSSEVLREGVGLCYAKSHLLAAVLRAGGVPTGLCYQRLRDGDGHVLHGLVAVHLDGRWHRQDARGNKPGVAAQFSLHGERLAFAVDPAAGEIDYPDLFTSAAAPVVEVLRGATDVLALCTGGLPTGLD
ncbi:transglutaminase [Blastococcus sp. TF02-8]|nr:transglutaminase [Blastococcus sp. TF02-8]